MDAGQVRPGNGAANGGDVIKAGTAASFSKDVLEASRDALVLVDFWAPWCGPCKQLTPVLEKVVQSYAGRVRLVKINIDEHPSVASQLRVQSIPTVYAFRDGRPLDGFTGAQPASAIRQMIDRLAGPDEGAGDIEAVLESGDQALAANDLPGAAEVFAAVLDVDQHNVRALLGLVRVYLQSGDLSRAEATLALVAPDMRVSAAYESVKAALELAKKASQAGSTSDIESRLAANPADHQARFDLAVALAAKGDKSSAVDHLIEIITRDRNWNEEAARRQLLEFFNAWGHKDPATAEGRRKLSTLLFR